ncbi:ACT domain-containing protein [Sphaerisporangium flaviroseum]
MLTSKYWMCQEKEPAGPSPRTGHDVFFGMIDDPDERTLIFASEQEPEGFPGDGYGPLTAFRIRTSRPFAAPGFLAALCAAIAATESSVLVMSTFTFDYIFVRQERSELAREALEGRGLRVESP